MPFLSLRRSKTASMWGHGSAGMEYVSSMRMRGSALFVATLLALPFGVWLVPPWDSLFPFWAVYFVVFAAGVWMIPNVRLQGFALVAGAFLAVEFAAFLVPCTGCDSSEVPAYLLLAMCAVAFLAGVRMLVRGRR